jgi:hypothetical protein
MPRPSIRRIRAIAIQLTPGNQRKQPIRPVYPQNQTEGVSFATINATNSQLQERFEEADGGAAKSGAM